MPLRLIEPVARGGQPGAGDRRVRPTSTAPHGASMPPDAGAAPRRVRRGRGGAGYRHRRRPRTFRGVTLIQKDFTGEGDGDHTATAPTLRARFRADRGGGAHRRRAGRQAALIGKVLGRQRSATTAELAAAIQWAVNTGHAGHQHVAGPRLSRPGALVGAAGHGGRPGDLKALAQYRDNVRLFDTLSAFVAARAAQHSGALLVAAAATRAGATSARITPSKSRRRPPPMASLPWPRSPPPARRTSNSTSHPSPTFAPASPRREWALYFHAKGRRLYHPKWHQHGHTHVAGVATLWAERQLQREGVVRLDSLRLNVLGKATCQRIPAADHLEVGEGLVTAPPRLDWLKPTRPFLSRRRLCVRKKHGLSQRVAQIHPDRRSTCSCSCAVSWTRYFIIWRVAV